MNKYQWKSPLGEKMQEFLTIKRMTGFKYEREGRLLEKFDEYCFANSYDSKTKELLTGYLEAHKKNNWGVALGEAPLFFNQRHQPLSRWGISYILDKYVCSAQKDNHFSIDFPITPHVLRHAKAMGMLKAGIHLIYIRDFLGHSNVVTTEVYARSDTEMKRKALEQSYKELYTE